MVSTTEPPYLMNSATFTRNTLPQRGATGRIGATHRGIVRETDTMKSHGVTLTDAQRAAFQADEHAKLAALPDDDYRLALYRIFGKFKPNDLDKQHAAVDAALALAARDGRPRDTDHILTLAGQEYAPLHTELADFLKGQQAKMDAQKPLIDDKNKPTGDKSLFGKPVSELKKGAPISRKNPPSPFPPGALSASDIHAIDEFERSIQETGRPPELRRPQTAAERAADLDATLGVDLAIDDNQPAPEPQPEATPAPAKTLRDVWGEKMVAAYGKHAAAIEFARATGRKNWKAATDDGMDDAVIAKMLEDHLAANPATVDVPHEKPAEKAPQSVETPAMATVPPVKHEVPNAPALPTAKQANPRPTTKGPKVPEYHPLASADEVRAKYTIRVQGNREYLQVAGRILLFRMDHKAGRIETEMVTSTPDFFVFKASIYGTDGVLLATGHAMATVAGSAKFSGRTLEKAETSAIGRALAHAGYGTDQAGEDVDEDDMLSDAPIAA